MSDTTDDMEAGAAEYEDYLEKQETYELKDALLKIRRNTMADVQKVQPRTAGGKPTMVPQPTAFLNRNMSLPTEKRIPSPRFADYAYAIYGERGVGKSTLANELFDGKAYFCMFESDRTLPVYGDDIRDWATFVGKVDTFLKGGHDFKGIVIDNGQMLYDCAMEFACEKYGFDHPGGMNDYGQSWSKVKKEFISPLRKLLASRYGLIVICHVLEKEIETESGRKFTRIRPDWSNQADQFLGAFVENIFYYYFRGDQRYLQIVGDDLITAKIKIKNHFFNSKGDRVTRIPMGNKNEKHAAASVLNAFNNKQEETYADRKESEPISMKSKVRPSFSKK